MSIVIYSTLEGLFHPSGAVARVFTESVTGERGPEEKTFDRDSGQEVEIRPAPADFRPKSML